MATGDILLSSNFELNSQRPLDARINVASIAERDAIPLIQRYDRMIVSVRGGENYQLKLGTVDNDLNNNLNWGILPGGEHYHDKIFNQTQNNIVDLTTNHTGTSMIFTFSIEPVSGIVINSIALQFANCAVVNDMVIDIYDRIFSNGEQLAALTDTLLTNPFHRLTGLSTINTGKQTYTFPKIELPGGKVYTFIVYRETGNFNTKGDLKFYLTNNPTSSYRFVVAGSGFGVKAFNTATSNLSFELNGSLYNSIVKANQNDVTIEADIVEVKTPQTNFTGNIRVNGDIIQDGQTYETHTEQLFTEKDLIILREKAIAALANGEYSGFKIFKYDAVNDLIFAVDNNGIARIGDFGSLLQALATREDNPIDGAFAKWNQSALRFDTFDLESYFLKRESIVDSYGITGFVDGDNINIAYSYANRTITLTGNLTYYFRGQKKQLTSPWTSIAHTNASGKYFLFSTDGINFTWSDSVWEFKDCMIVVVKRGATNLESFAIRETHKLLDSEAHKEFHDLFGTYRSLGGLLTAGSYTENTATDSANSPAFDSAVLEDEDLKSLVNSWPKGLYTTAYIGVGNLMVFDSTKTLPFHSSGSFLNVNNPSTGAMANGVSNRYYNVYQIIVPVCSDSDSQKYRMIMLQPQATFTSLALAQAESVNSLKFGDMVNTFTEFVIYARITYVTANGDNNTGKCRIAPGGISYVSGTKASQTNITGFSANDHALLSNREWVNSGHSGTSGSFPDFDGSGLAVETTKNTAFNLALETTIANIKMNGAASLGALATLARADHIHPSDTSRLAATKAAIEALLTGLITSHTHDYAPLISPTFIGDVITTGSFNAANGINAVISSKNGTDLPSTYPEGITQMAVGTSNTGWIATYMQIVTFKAGVSRVAQWAYDFDTPNPVYYRHKSSSGDTWTSWVNIVSPNGGLTNTLYAAQVNDNYFDVPIGHTIDKIVLKTNNTTGGNFTLGLTSGVVEVANLTITASCTESGNITVVLNGVSTNIAISNGMTISAVASAIRNTSFPGWITGNSGGTVTFTATTTGIKTDATYNANATGASGTMITTTQGSASSIDVVASVAIGTITGVLKYLTILKPDAGMSISATKRFYIGLSTSTNVDLYVTTSKF